ncbi:unnamed protein product, partial [Owenia fusiformis]
VILKIITMTQRGDVSVALDMGKIGSIGSGADLRQRSHTDTLNSTGVIHPFVKHNKSVWGSARRELGGLLAESGAKKVLLFIGITIVSYVMLMSWCRTTNSLALLAYTYLIMFGVLNLLTILLTMWVQKQPPSPAFSFGYERFEVIAVFATTILAQLGSLFIMKESIERMIIQPEIHTGRLLIATLFAFLVHMMLAYGVENKAMNHVIAASTSSWLQEHVADMSEGLCHVVPGLSKLLLPRINPFTLIAFAGSLALILEYILIDINNYFSADTCAALWIAVMICGTMFPMAIYSGKMLLQTTPAHIIGQLDKSIREASTLDGVLEFRNEHFWTLSFGVLAGSVHVRIRRDADEQLVLAHVANRLSNVVKNLTIQTFKDDWTRGSTFHMSRTPNLGTTLSTPGVSPIKINSSITQDGYSSVNLGAQLPDLKPTLNHSHSHLNNMPPPLGGAYSPYISSGKSSPQSTYNIGVKAPEITPLSTSTPYGTPSAPRMPGQNLQRITLNTNNQRTQQTNQRTTYDLGSSQFYSATSANIGAGNHGNQNNSSFSGHINENMVPFLGGSFSKPNYEPS